MKGSKSVCVAKLKTDKSADEQSATLVCCPCGSETGSAHFHAQDPRISNPTVRLAGGVSAPRFAPRDDSRIFNLALEPQTPPPRHFS
jgi:hypothetical protein